MNARSEFIASESPRYVPEIPQEPKIKLDVLRNLPPELCIRTQSVVMRDLIQDPLIEELSGATGITRQTVLRYKRRGQYPMSFILALDKMVNEDIVEIVRDEEDLTFFSRWKDVKLPLYLTPALAYFVGYLQGDGCIESNGNRIDFTDEYREQLEMINRLSTELFDISGLFFEASLNGRVYCHKLAIGSKVLNSYLHNVFGIIRGRKTILRIPEDVFADNKILRWYLSGLFDADGTLPKNPGKCVQFFIDVTFKDKIFIQQIREALRRFSVETYAPRCRIAKSPSSDMISRTWELQIRRHKDISTFLRRVGFAHPHKRERQRKLLALLAP